MKKVINIDLKIFVIIILGVILLSSVTGVLAYSLSANDVSFTSKDSSWKVANTKEALDDLRENVGGSVTGVIFSYMGTKVPYGYLACDGSIYNISDYYRLAEQIKYNFGSYNYFGGDGEETFAVPDLRGEFLRGTGTNNTTLLSGGEVGIHSDQGLPNITGSTGEIYINNANYHNASGAIENGKDYDNWGAAVRGGAHGTLNFDASKSNPIYGNSTDVRPTNTSVLYIIKY